jgi:hypothetical protein
VNTGPFGRPSGDHGGDEVADCLPFVIRDLLAAKAVLGSRAAFAADSCAEPLVGRGAGDATWQVARIRRQARIAAMVAVARWLWLSKPPRFLALPLRL